MAIAGQRHFRHNMLLGHVHLCDPVDCSPPGSSVHGISQAIILEWVVIPFSRKSSWPRDQTHISCIHCVSYIAGRFSPGEPPGKHFQIQSVQFSSVAQSCPTLCNTMDCSSAGLPIHYQLPEFTQTHVHWVSDAIQPSHPLSSPSPPTFKLSQHQGLFKWVILCIRWPKYWFQLQYQFFQRIFRNDFL